MQRDEKVGAELVCDRRTARLGEALAGCRSAGAVDPNASGVASTLEPRGQVIGDVRLGPPEDPVGDTDARVATTMARVDDNSLVNECWTRRVQADGFAQQSGASADDLSTESMKCR